MHEQWNCARVDTARREQLFHNNKPGQGGTTVTNTAPISHTHITIINLLRHTYAEPSVFVYQTCTAAEAAVNQPLLWIWERNQLLRVPVTKCGVVARPPPPTTHTCQESRSQHLLFPLLSISQLDYPVLFAVDVMELKKMLSIWVGCLG